MKLILGLVGEKLAGKGTVAEKIIGISRQRGKAADHFPFSDILLSIPTIFFIPKKEVSRSKLQSLAAIMEEIFGKGCIAKGMKGRVENSDADIVIVDGIRLPTDLEMLRSFPNNILLYVTADLDRRYKRAKERRRSGEETLTLEQFMAQERADTEKNISSLGAQADYTIANNSDELSFFEEQIKLFYGRYIRPKT